MPDIFCLSHRMFCSLINLAGCHVREFIGSTLMNLLTFSFWLEFLMGSHGPSSQWGEESELRYLFQWFPSYFVTWFDYFLWLKFAAHLDTRYPQTLVYKQNRAYYIFCDLLAAYISKSMKKCFPAKD